MYLPNNATAEILSYADSRHYLVLIADRMVTDDDRQPLRFRGLAEAKTWLRDQGFDEAFLRMETPYDEMVDVPCAPDRIKLLLH